MVVLGGCAADGEAPPRVDTASHVEVQSRALSADTDVCALAAELPIDDICSLVCDPAAMASQLLVDGNQPGTCYQLYCTLPGDAHVLVGVCLPP
jgi:hypothetical protein